MGKALPLTVLFLLLGMALGVHSPDTDTPLSWEFQLC